MTDDTTSGGHPTSAAAPPYSLPAPPGGLPAQPEAQPAPSPGNPIPPLAASQMTSAYGQPPPDAPPPSTPTYRRPASPYASPGQSYGQPSQPYGQFPPSGGPAAFYEQPAFVEPVPGVPPGQFSMQPAPFAQTLQPPPGSTRPTVRVWRLPFFSLETNTPFLASAVLFVMGALLVGGGVLVARGPTPIAGGVTTNGTVAAVTPLTSCGGTQHGCTTTYEAILTFVTRTGTKMVTSGRSSTEVSVGQTIPVSYDPAHPGDARPLFPRSWAFVPLFAIGALLIFVAFATLVAVARQRWARHKSVEWG